MGGVDVALKALHPVALAQDGGDGVLAVGAHVGLEVRQGRELRAGAHVGPDDAVALLAGVGRDLHLVLEVGLGGLGGHVDAVAADVVLPAVVDAADAGLLVATEEEAGAPVGAVVVDEADGAGGVAEGDEVLAEQADADGVGVGAWELAGHEGRDPVLPHELAHSGAGANPGEGLVVLLREHCGPPLLLAVGQGESIAVGWGCQTGENECSQAEDAVVEIVATAAAGTSKRGLKNKNMEKRVRGLRILWHHSTNAAALERDLGMGVAWG